MSRAQTAKILAQAIAGALHPVAAIHQNPATHVVTSTPPATSPVSTATAAKALAEGLDSILQTKQDDKLALLVDLWTGSLTGASETK
jgi:hypothetical protein